MIEAVLEKMSKETVIKGLKETVEVNVKDIPLETMDIVENKSLEALEVENIILEKPDLEINTINSHLEGKRHSISDVLYERDTITLSNNEKIEGIFPDFESVKDFKLPNELLEETDAKQMRYCNEKLKESLESKLELRSKFTETQLKEIEADYKPSGFTWHHHQEVGKMQLVDTETHRISGHTGGKSIWGAGNR